MTVKEMGGRSPRSLGGVPSRATGGGKMTTSVTRALTISAMLVSLSAGSSLSADDDAASTDDPRIKIGFELAHQQGVMLNKKISPR